MKPENQNNGSLFGSFGTKWRLQAWYGLVLAVLALFIIRLFYLQVIRHDYYQTQALSGQLKQYSIPAERGLIRAHDGEAVVPLVLNEKLYTLFADPVYIKNSSEVAMKLAQVTGANANDYKKLLEAKKTRYVVLAKKLSKRKHEALDQLKLKGIGTREETYRTYPQGNLAAQVLGFVNDEGSGRYGVEQYLDTELKGKDGLLKAITDASGVPLVSNRSNIQIDPTAGKDVVLTIEIAMQRQLEDILKQGLDNAQSQSGSAIVLDPNSGAIKAVANYPTYNPAEYFKEKNIANFSNAAFSSPLEPGSVMKPLTAAAALNQGVVSADSTYYDSSYFSIDGYKITNIEEDGGAGVRSVRDILQLSLNTGAVWLLKQMGGGALNAKARTTWHNYMVGHYNFGKNTGVESYEVPGIIPNPLSGDGLGIQYANSSFGQGMTVTPLQLAAAFSSVVNGGKYYRPHLVDKYIDADAKASDVQPVVASRNVVKPDVSSTIRSLMDYVVQKNNRPAVRDGYEVGGKTGTAQIAKPGGGYYEDRYNGMYAGFVGGNKPQYVIVVRVNEPHIAGYAGSKAAAPIFASISNMLINNFNIVPRN